MLVLSRKIGEKIVIGKDIVIMVTAIAGDRVRLGISGPPEVPIHREEIYQRVQEEEQSRTPPLAPQGATSGATGARPSAHAVRIDTVPRAGRRPPPAPLFASLGPLLANAPNSDSIRAERLRELARARSALRRRLWQCSARSWATDASRHRTCTSATRPVLQGACRSTQVQAFSDGGATGAPKIRHGRRQ